MSKPKEKQIVRVLAAIEAGCRTSIEASAVCGLPVKTCSAWLYELTKRGTVVRTGKLSFPHNRIKYAITYSMPTIAITLDRAVARFRPSRDRSHATDRVRSAMTGPNVSWGSLVGIS